MEAPESVLGPVRAPFRAIATTVVPEAARLDELGWSELEALVEGALADKPAGMRRQLRLFVRALEAAPLVRYGRRFTRLDEPSRARVLHGAETNRVELLRKGFWGLRTLILLGYYGRSAGAAEIGYRSDRRGWEARR